MSMDTKPVQKALLALYREMGSWAQISSVTGFSPYGVRKMALGEAALRPESWDQLYQRLPHKIPPPPWANQQGVKLVEAREQFSPEPDLRNLLPLEEGEPALDELERAYLLKVLRAFRQMQVKKDQLVQVKRNDKPA